DFTWSPPVLEFTSERHPQTVHGSTRATLQRWTVDLDRLKADCVNYSYRQVVKRKPPLDVDSIAEDLAAKILSGVSDPRLQWKESGDVVQFDIGKVIPGEDSFKQTLSGRRTRFKKALDSRLLDKGWEFVAKFGHYWRYRKRNKSS